MNTLSQSDRRSPALWASVRGDGAGATGDWCSGPSSARVRGASTDTFVLIANPHSGGGSSATKVAEVETELRKRGIRYQLNLASDLENAERLSRAANRAGFPVVVAVGGDGTINRVLNGFYDEDGNQVSGAAFGVIHTGSSPDFCRSYGVPTKVGPAVETLLEGVTHPLRPMRILRHLQGAEQSSSVYACCANIGLGAEVARGANSGSRDRFGDFLGTFISLMRALRTTRPFTVQLDVDGARKIMDGVMNLAVGRSYYVASGLKVRHELGADDGRFYILTLRKFGWRKLVWLLRTLYGGRPITGDNCLTLEYARRLEVTTPERAVEVEFDGDPAGWCPCSIQPAVAAVELICGKQR